MQSVIFLHKPMQPIKSSSESTTYLAYADQRTKLCKFKHKMQASFRDIGFYFQMAAPLFRYLNRKYRRLEFAPVKEKNSKLCYSLKKVSWNQKDGPSDGLCVFLHGLNGLPGLDGVPFIWESYIKKLNQNHPQVHCFAPDIYKGGNHRLEKVSKPVLRVIRDYIAKHPGKPICLVGVSNGGRIAAYIEKHLAQESCAIRTVSIAGANLGTRFMNRLIKMKLARCFGLHPSIQRDLRFESKRSKKLFHSWKKSVENAQGKRSHKFFATSEDDRIFPFYASFPRVQKKAKYHLLHGHSHISIIKGAEKFIVESVSHWFIKHSPN